MIFVQSAHQWKKNGADVLIAREHSMYLGPKIFGHDEHDEAIYIVYMKKNKTKTHIPQFSLLISFLCLAQNIYRFSNCSPIYLAYLNKCPGGPSGQGGGGGVKLI